MMGSPSRVSLATLSAPPVLTELQAARDSAAVRASEVATIRRVLIGTSWCYRFVRASRFCGLGSRFPGEIGPGEKGWNIEVTCLFADEGGNVGCDTIGFREGVLHHTGKRVLIWFAIFWEDVGGAEEDLAGIPAEFKISDRELFVGPHEEFGCGGAMVGGNGNGCGGNHRCGTDFFEGLDVEVDLRVMSFETGFEDIVSMNPLKAPTGLFEGGGDRIE